MTVIISLFLFSGSSNLAFATHERNPGAKSNQTCDPLFRNPLQEIIQASQIQREKRPFLLKLLQADCRSQRHPVEALGFDF